MLLCGSARACGPGRKGQIETSALRSGSRLAAISAEWRPPRCLRRLFAKIAHSGPGWLARSGPAGCDSRSRPGSERSSLPPVSRSVLVRNMEFEVWTSHGANPPFFFFFSRRAVAPVLHCSAGFRAVRFGKRYVFLVSLCSVARNSVCKISS